MDTSFKQIPLEEEMQSAYLDYAMSVIVSRALPDVRDGLKPVHRRIIFAMNEVGNHYSKPFRKSARVVGEVMGKYHPHGDAAIYETMVRLAQWFSMRETLVEGQGNFGSMDGDSAAASRYTEARLSQLSDWLLADIEQDTVNFVPNYDNTLKEPSVLPARFPNLLVNGSNGIAVGMATYVPTHNLGEVIDACCAVVDNPEISVDELLEKYILGPDFPTGGIVLGRDGIRKSFKTGHGSVLVRAKTEILKAGKDRECIVVHEIPYQVNKAKLVERIADLVKNKTIEGISDIRDESNKDGVRIVVDLKKDAIGEVILNQLFRFTPLQVNISYNMLALVKNKPMRLSLREIIDNFLEFREEVIVRRCKFNLRQDRSKAHVLIGFCMALANIDVVIELIKSSKDKNEAKNRLMTGEFGIGTMGPWLELIEDEQKDAVTYHFSEAQALAILDLRLHKLTNLEQDKIQDELKQVTDDIKDLLSILASKERIKQIIKTEMLEVKEKFGSPRLTKIENNYADVADEDLIQSEDVVITYTNEGYIKRVPLDTYRAQKRGGKGRNGMDTKDTDLVKDIVVANTHDTILYFSSLGRVYASKVHQLPAAGPESKGRAIVNILPLDLGEQISTILAIRKDEDLSNRTLVFVTSRGNVRRNKFSDFSNIQSNGKRAMTLEEGEKLINVMLANENDDVFIATKNGICNRFSTNNVRVFAGRDSNGVRGIKLKDADEVISTSLLYPWSLDKLEEREEYLKSADKYRAMIKSIDKRQRVIGDRNVQLAIDERFILTVTDKGFGQVVSFYEYRSTSRGTQGFKNIDLSAKNGCVVAAFPVDLNTQIIMVTTNGKVLRCKVGDMRITRRGAKGVILFRLDDGERVSSVSRIDESDSAEDGE